MIGVAARSAATVVAGWLLLASTRLTWAGVIAVAIFVGLVWDAQRRIRRLLTRMDALEGKANRLGDDIDDLTSLVTGGATPRQD